MTTHFSSPGPWQARVEDYDFPNNMQCANKRSLFNTSWTGRHRHTLGKQECLRTFLRYIEKKTVF